MTQYDVLTFDCYGTLIDWESGIRTAFHNALSTTKGPVQLTEKGVAMYETEERKVEKQTPHLTYREVLANTALAVAAKISWNLPATESFFLSRELPEWRPFPDTNPALERLAKKHTLGILSNIDNDLLERTLKHLRAKFDIIVTAEKVGSYKPAPAHFNEARRIIGDKAWLHVASSEYHDIEPVCKLGIQAAWVNRKHLPFTHRLSPDNVLEVRDLLELADRLHC
jgi:2-haloalkanoic acid dehalogenase type II